MQQLDVGSYLTRLGLTDPGRPLVAALFELHRAHVERVPYENLEIHLGSPTTVDPGESAERIVRRRRGGYCFHLNGAFATLLSGAASWFAALADVFGLTLDDVPVPRRQALWERVCRAHETWSATRRVSA